MQPDFKSHTGSATKSLQVTCLHMYAVLSTQNSEWGFDFEAPLIWRF